MVNKKMIQKLKTNLYCYKIKLEEQLINYINFTETWNQQLTTQREQFHNATLAVIMNTEFQCPY